MCRSRDLPSVSLTESSSLGDSPCPQPQETLGHAEYMCCCHGGTLKAQATPISCLCGDTPQGHSWMGGGEGGAGGPASLLSLGIITACQHLAWLVCVPVTEVIITGGIRHSQLLASCPLPALQGPGQSALHPTCLVFPHGAATFSVGYPWTPPAQNRNSLAWDDSISQIPCRVLSGEGSHLEDTPPMN